MNLAATFVIPVTSDYFNKQILIRGSIQKYIKQTPGDFVYLLDKANVDHVISIWMQRFHTLLLAFYFKTK